jgi:hypothetical protein
MASYALLLALADFSYSAPSQSLSFSPKVNAEDFACFFCVDSGWGMIKQRFGIDSKRATVEIHAGELVLRKLNIGFVARQPRITLTGDNIDVTSEVLQDKTTLRFLSPVAIRSGQSLIVDQF